MPNQLEKAEEKGKKEASRELSKDYEVEKRMLIQKYESEKELLTVKIEALEKTVTGQDKEVTSLREET